MKALRIIFCIAWMTSLILLSTSCGIRSGGERTSTGNTSRLAEESPYSPRQIADIILAAIPGKPPMLPLAPVDPYYHDYLSAIYRLDEATTETGIVYYADGVYATEIAVFLLADEADADTVKASLSAYALQRGNAFSGYAPEEAEILRASLVVSQGRTVALLICSEAREAEALFFACFHEEPPALPDEPVTPNVIATDAPHEASLRAAHTGASVPDADPDEEESITNRKDDAEQASTEQANGYDPAAILAARINGNSASLSPKNRDILDACEAVIADVITEEMDAYSKELAIHDWIIHWADYDRGALSNTQNAIPDPDNDNPYGLLLRKKAICKGFTSTFQLLMDMLNVECITVNGSSVNGEHAWNMVRLDGEWYCVDVTWDDPISLIKTPEIHHRYFNVNSAYMKDSGHIWDESAFPESTAGKLYRTSR